MEMNKQNYSKNAFSEAQQCKLSINRPYGLLGASQLGPVHGPEPHLDCRARFSRHGEPIFPTENLNGFVFVFIFIFINSF